MRLIECLLIHRKTSCKASKVQISLKKLIWPHKASSQKNCIESGRYWKAYKGELEHANANGNRLTTMVAPWWELG